MPPLLGPLKIVGAGNPATPPTVGLTGYPTENPFAANGSFFLSTDGNLPPTVISGSGPNARGIYDPLLSIENPVVTGTDPTTYGTSDGTAYGTPNGAFGVAADYNFGVEPNGGVTIDHLILEDGGCGVLVLRSHNNVIEHNLFYNINGAAPVIVTGDAGDATGSSTTGVSVDNTTEENTFIDNGDHMEYTRGTSNSFILHNTFIEDPEPLDPANDQDNTIGSGYLQAGNNPSQTIEFAGSGDNDNTVNGNIMLGQMQDGIARGGTGLTVTDNFITGNTSAISLATDSLYENNVITGNHDGIDGTGAGDTILHNSIYGQGATLALGSPSPSAVLGIDYTGTGPSPSPDNCSSGVQSYPVLTSITTVAGGSTAWSGFGAAYVNGTLTCNPQASYTIELYANQANTSAVTTGTTPFAAGFGEGQTFEASQTAQADASGNVTFAIRLSTIQATLISRSAPFLSATATAIPYGTATTSEFSRTLEMHGGL